MYDKIIEHLTSGKHVQIVVGPSRAYLLDKRHVTMLKQDDKGNILMRQGKGWAMFMSNAKIMFEK